MDVIIFNGGPEEEKKFKEARRLSRMPNNLTPEQKKNYVVDEDKWNRYIWKLMDSENFDIDLEDYTPNCPSCFVRPFDFKTRDKDKEEVESLADLAIQHYNNDNSNGDVDYKVKDIVSCNFFLGGTGGVYLITFSATNKNGENEKIFQANTTSAFNCRTVTFCRVKV